MRGGTGPALGFRGSAVSKLFRCFGAARGGRVGTWLVGEEGDTAFWSGDQLSTETVGCDRLV